MMTFFIPKFIFYLKKLIIFWKHLPQLFYNQTSLKIINKILVKSNEPQYGGLENCKLVKPHS